MSPSASQNGISTWRTACSGLPAELSGEELQTLGHHLHQCAHPRSTVYLWRCVGQELMTLVATRVLTTALLVTFVLVLLKSF